MFRLRLWIFLLFLLALQGDLYTQSQNDITLTIAIPTWQQTVYSESLFDRFETEHPGVRIVTRFEEGIGARFADNLTDETMTLRLTF